MKKFILCLLILVLLIPFTSHAQSIFPDFVWTHAEDMSIFWVLTDPNGRKYKGNCDVALGTDPNTYCQQHMDEWLQEIYEMNTNPNIPDWQDTHLGKYTQTISQIENIDSWAENNAILKKIVKYLQKQSAMSE